MSEVATIHGGRKPGEPSSAVIESLERMLAEARRGELIGLAYVTARADPVTPIIGTGWDGEAGTRYALAAGILILQERYATALQEG